jgi:hypothetical protein
MPLVTGIAELVALTTRASRVRVVGEEICERVRELKHQPGRNIWMAGAARLAAAFVDELLFKV